MHSKVSVSRMLRDGGRLPHTISASYRAAPVELKDALGVLCVKTGLFLGPWLPCWLKSGTPSPGLSV